MSEPAAWRRSEAAAAAQRATWARTASRRAADGLTDWAVRFGAHVDQDIVRQVLAAAARLHGDSGGGTPAS